jgi:hypothetical protein
MKPIHISTSSLINPVVITVPSDKAELCPTDLTWQIEFFWCLKMDRQPDSETTSTVFFQTTKEVQRAVSRHMQI